MKYIFIIFFLIGMGTYNLIPKDWPVGDPPAPPMDEVTATMNDGKGCVTYLEDHAVGKNLLPLQRTVCQK